MSIMSGVPDNEMYYSINVNDINISHSRESTLALGLRRVSIFTMANWLIGKKLAARQTKCVCNLAEYFPASIEKRR